MLTLKLNCFRHELDSFTFQLGVCAFTYIHPYARKFDVFLSGSNFILKNQLTYMLIEREKLYNYMPTSNFDKFPALHYGRKFL